MPNADAHRKARRLNGVGQLCFVQHRDIGLCSSTALGGLRKINCVYKTVDHLIFVYFSFDAGFTSNNKHSDSMFELIRDFARFMEECWKNDGSPIAVWTIVEHITFSYTFLYTPVF